MNRHSVGGRRGQVVERVTEDVEQPAEGRRTDRHPNGSAGALDGHSAGESFRVAEDDRAHAGRADVERHFQKHLPAVGPEAERFVDGRQVRFRELGLDDRAADRRDPARLCSSGNSVVG